MVVIHIHDLAVVKHLLVDDVEIRAVGVQQHALGFSAVGIHKIDFHFDVVEHAQGVGAGIVTHRIDDQRADANAAHGALHLNRGFGHGGEAAGLVGCGVVDKLDLVQILVLADRGLMRDEGADAVVGKTVICCRVTDYIHLWRCPERHGQQLVRGRQFRRADFARGVSAFDGDFRESAPLGGNFDALDGAITESGTERREVAVRDFSLCFVAQVDAAILGHGKHCTHGQNKEKG